MPKPGEILDPADFSGRQKISDANKNATATAEMALGIGKDWKEHLGNIYNPYMQMGLSALGNAQQAAGYLQNNNIPQAYQADRGPMAQLFNQYQSQVTRPEYQQANLPMQADYDNAMNTDQYRELMAASNDAGGGLAGGLANQYTYDIANREYDNAMQNYEMAQMNNARGNELNQSMYQQGTGLQDYLYQLDQQNYKNRMAGYSANQGQLTDYLNQLYNQADMGMNSTNQYAGYGTDVANAQIETLSGIGNAYLNAAGAGVQASGNNLNTAGQVGGSIIKDWKSS